MKVKRRVVLTGILLVLLGAAAYAIWQQPTVQEALLSRADLASLSNRVAASPTDWRAQYWYGKRSAEAGEVEQAETALRVALGMQPDYLPGLTELGKVVLAQGRTEEAFQLLRMVAGRDPGNVEARLALATLYRMESAYPRAMEVLQEVLKLDPNNRIALYELGAAQALARQYTKAEETFRRALKLYPNDVPLRVGLGKVQMEQGRLPEAEQSVRAAEQQKPNDVEMLLALSQILARKQPLAPNREEALRILQRVRTLDPQRLDLSWRIAEIHAATGRWREALPELLATIEVTPRRTQAYYLLAQAYRNLGDHRDSQKAQSVFHAKKQHDLRAQDLESRITEFPDRADLRFELGEVHASAGYLDLAAQAYQRGLERDPKNTRARKRLAELIQSAIPK